jgi:predicted ArsR family transcriptional regulator
MPVDASDLRAAALLAEPIRRSLYDWVVAAGRPVAKDEAATGIGISRALAAFHLDRLVDEGLLSAEFRRRSGRTGPGAGRPAKLYRRAEAEISVSIPERRYEVAARIMADAFEAASGGRLSRELTAAARAAGRSVGMAARRAAGPRAGRGRLREALVGALRGQGYEPGPSTAATITLANCPFHALVAEHRTLVCGMNLAMAEGILSGVGPTGLEAHLDPAVGRCCVVFEPAPQPRLSAG